MAAAIEARRKQRGLAPGEFATRAGLTRQGLDPVRKGLRKAYQDKVKLGVARALDWPDDALDLLMDGADPATFPTVIRSDGLEQRVTNLELRADRIQAEVRQILDELREEP